MRLRSRDDARDGSCRGRTIGACPVDPPQRSLAHVVRSFPAASWRRAESFVATAARWDGLCSSAS